MLKNQKGITLIALVITIIVLLILAGITITMLSSQDSAPNKAAEAKIINDVGAAKDAVGLTASSALQEWYSTKYTATTLPENFPATAQDAVLAANYSSAKVTITKDTSGDTKKIIIKSTEGRSSDSNKYSVTGEVSNAGGITWKDGEWQAESGN